ncbi:uncharacterized protein BP01DRAFT_41149 [Aspergillus saccharolyticus JOP 1030-1]|uniref:Uncharacterized protein n=1 Tax=Aspergillus saccharolyticus JOP 1030-1 TaxID=1450539 RepID=A0A318ZNG7_9EURO|nr:hypothetical protein BP01DRAFT_41149 [Aspergillus saccharolyticus JOP 1030-1]PYH45450.1 hypothetical protein BP01DRAFT_41149 [Aspergillus saccharolyticus JOP 1030-1]
MKGTASLNYAPWFKNLHPPLPRTPRQSQQLLNALTTSFRRQLDREYPSASVPTPLNQDEVSEVHLPKNPESSSYATDKHLHSILENPLFRVQPRKEVRAKGSDRDSRLAKEPMVVFEELAAAGNVTLSALNNCLVSQLLLLSDHKSGEQFVKAMRDSRTASRIASWWSASDLNTRGLLFHPSITPHITKFLVAENMQSVALTWLKLLAQRDILGGEGSRLKRKDSRIGFGGLLNDLVLAEARYGGGIESAMRLYVSAGQLTTSDRIPIIKNEYWNATLLSAGGHLGQLIIQNEPDHASGVGQILYENYLQMINTVAANSLLHACVCMHHPTKPNARPYVLYVQALPEGRTASWSKLRRDHYMRAGFTALRILLDQNDSEYATWLAKYMQDTISQHLDPEDVQSAQYELARLEPA